VSAALFALQIIGVLAVLYLLFIAGAAQWVR
jgi:hypothetical protein